MEILSNDVECPICLDDAGLDSYRENKVIHCLVCGKFYHTNYLRKRNSMLKLY